jgi:hypothetical protein
MVDCIKYVKCVTVTVACIDSRNSPPSTPQKLSELLRRSLWEVTCLELLPSRVGFGTFSFSQSLIFYLQGWGIAAAFPSGFGWGSVCGVVFLFLVCNWCSRRLGEGTWLGSRCISWRVGCCAVVFHILLWRFKFVASCLGMHGGFVAGVMEGRKGGRDWYSIGVCTCDSQKPTKFALLPRSGSNLVVANLCTDRISIVAKQAGSGSTLKFWVLLEVVLKVRRTPTLRKLRKDCYSVGIFTCDWRLRSLDNFVFGKRFWKTN